MANTNKVSFAVSVTPKVVVDETDNAHASFTSIHESIRRSLGGAGEITANSGDVTVNGEWNEGVNTVVTSDGSTLPVDLNTDLIFIKHTGLLFGTTTVSAAADSVRVCLDGSVTDNLSSVNDNIAIATLTNGEAIALPRPGELSATNALGYVLKTGNSSNHVGVETLIVST
jgi:hypothetical protein